MQGWRILALPRATSSLRILLAALVLVTLVPVLLFAWWAALRASGSERHQIEQSTQEIARELADAVTRQLDTARNTLVVLASSQSLQRGDVERFQTKAFEVARTLNVQIVLRDPRQDKQIMNTGVPLGTPLDAARNPPVRQQAEDEVLRLRQPVVSNVFIGPLLNTPIVAVVAPVIRDGEVIYILSIGLHTDAFQRLFPRSRPQGALAAIIDGNSAFVARSEKHALYAGKPLHFNLAEAVQGQERALYDESIEGVPFFWANRRVESTSWFVGVGIPSAAIDAPLSAMTVKFAAGGGAILALALAAAYALGGYIGKTAGALGVDRQPTRAEFELLFQSAPNGVLVVDETGCVVLANRRMEIMFGYGHGELIGRPLNVLIPERYRARHDELRVAFQQGPQGGPMGAGREFFGVRKDGGEFPIEVQLNPINTKSGSLVLAAVMDITERKRAAEQLSNAVAERDHMRRHALQAQERERLRLAHELHDQSAQSLAATMVGLKLIEQAVGESERNRLRGLRAQLDEMSRGLHHIIWELRPPSIDELSLADAISTYAASWSAQFGIECDVHCTANGLDDLPDDVRTAIYRVTQEALTNVAKHGRSATSVSVIIERSVEMLRLTIEDNGDGFSEHALAQRRRGFGLSGMRERVALVGGEFNIESALDIGTTIFVRVPTAAARLRPVRHA